MTRIEQIKAQIKFYEANDSLMSNRAELAACDALKAELAALVGTAPTAAEWNESAAIALRQADLHKGYVRARIRDIRVFDPARAFFGVKELDSLRIELCRQWLCYRREMRQYRRAAALAGGAA